MITSISGTLYHHYWELIETQCAVIDISNLHTLKIQCCKLKGQIECKNKFCLTKKANHSSTDFATFNGSFPNKIGAQICIISILFGFASKTWETKPKL